MTDTEISAIPWWEREKMLTAKDKEAIYKAKHSYSEDIKEDWAETEVGKYEVRQICKHNYHREEFMAGMD